MNLRTTITSLFSALLIGLVVWYVANHWDEIRRIQFVAPQYIALLAVLMFVRYCLGGVLNWQVIRSLDVEIPIWKMLQLTFAGIMMNKLLPMPVGAGYRATYLKSRYQFPFGLFASTLAALFFYSLLVSTLLGLLAMAWIYVQEGKYQPGATLVLTIAFLACLSTFVIPLLFKMESSQGWLASRARKALSSWKTLIGSRDLVVGATVVVALSALLGAFGMIVAFKSIGVTIGFAGALLLLASQHIGSLIKVTPGAIGFQEMVGIYFATLLTPTTAEAAVVFGMARMISTLVAVVFGLPAMWSLTGRAPSVTEAEHE